MNESCAGKPEARFSSILSRLTTHQERRQKLIAAIGEKVNKLYPIEERPQVSESGKELPSGSVLGEIDSFVNVLHSDNNRLELILETLDKIVS